MELKTKRLVLRTITKDDVQDLISGLNNINVSRNLALVPFPYTQEDAIWWINKCSEEEKKKPRTDYNFSIEHFVDKRIIGSVDLSHVDEFNGTATLGYWLNEKYWKQGIMTEAVERLLEYAFQEIGLRRINVSAFVENDGSNALIKKMGFDEEGKRNKAVKSKADGKIHDEFIYGLLKINWKRKIIL
ncbi:MAG: GNAT family N-acetyltransferase [Candidatus Aenigmarchaeota archaeon]|nr:GNAT family N-acetyltransferase [Candidatus Aenigmarchaeota archaeon]